MYIRMENSERRRQRKNLRTARELLSWVFCICGAVLAALLLRLFVFEMVRVDGPSMQPTLYKDQTVFVEKISSASGKIERFDVVIVRYPNREGAYVKRVVGLPGDTIEIKNDGHLYINGERQEESYLLEELIIPGFDAYTVPEGCYFVMGDNRNNSLDSRSADVGAIAKEDIIGHALFVVWPLNQMKKI